MNIISTKLDDYYINPYKFIYKKESTIIDILDKLISNSNNKGHNVIIKEENDNKFNPLLFKLVANNNVGQLENTLINNKNINVNEQDKDGDTPLHIAVFLCNIQIVSILLNNNANLLIKDKWGQIPIHRLCFSINDVKILELINIFLKLNNKNIFNEQDNYGNTALHLILKHIIKNKILLTNIHKLIIKNIKKIMNIKIKNNDNQNINDLIKIINNS